MDIVYLYAIIALAFTVCLILGVIFSPKSVKLDVGIVCGLIASLYGLLSIYCSIGVEMIATIFCIASIMLLAAAIFFAFEKPYFKARWQLFIICLLGTTAYVVLGFTYYRVVY